MSLRTWGESGCISAIGIVISLSGCTETTAPSKQKTPTYAEDVAPILAEHCTTCHRAGGIAPFVLEHYDDARVHAEAIRKSTANRTMPPFILDNSGVCQTYVEARWLTDEQIATIDRWVEGGSPAGDLERGIGILPPPPLPRLERVDQTLDMGTSYTPDVALFDDYRCFLVDPQLSADAFITAFDVHPGEARMVHHLTLFAIDSEKAEKQAEALDGAESGPGFSCFNDVRIPDTRWLVGWGPGEGALHLPKGTGLRMQAGRKTILQIHYNQENGVFPDRTRIDLTLEKQVDREAHVRRVADTDLNLPPKRNLVQETAEMPMPEASTLWGLWPHMHKLGTSLRVTAIHDGKESCLANADRYNFHWQGFAHYTKPIDVDRGDTMRITCSYDTLGRDDVTNWGQGTNDEMCIAFFYMTGR